MKLIDIDVNFFSGASLIIFDLDNTLVFPETTQTTKAVLEWFLNIKNKYQCVCASNSRTARKRKVEIEKKFGCDLFLSRHKKPSKKLFREIKNKYAPRKEKIFVVGDRLLIDVLFAKRNGAQGVWIEPLSGPKFLSIIKKIWNLIKQH